MAAWRGGVVAVHARARDLRAVPAEGVPYGTAVVVQILIGYRHGLRASELPPPEAFQTHGRSPHGRLRSLITWIGGGRPPLPPHPLPAAPKTGEAPVGPAPGASRRQSSTPARRQRGG